MTQSEFNLFLNMVVAICAALALINLALIKRRGTSSIVLSLAFLVMGGTVLAYGQQGMSTLVTLGGVVVFLLLAADFVLRAPNQQKRRRR
ncbi:MAG: hypothetical protein ACO1SV_11080 [Fimbriimonas sp.]